MAVYFAEEDGGQALFKRGLFEQPDSELRNNASFDPASLRHIATNSGLHLEKNPIRGADIFMIDSVVRFNPNIVRLLYEFHTASYGVMELDIRSYNDKTQAELALKDLLATCEAPLWIFGKEVPAELGNVTVQIGTALMWVRDCLLLRLEVEPATAGVYASNPDTMKSGSFAPYFPKPIWKFAHNLDVYMRENAVPIGGQTMPCMDLATELHTVKLGEDITLKLRSAEGLLLCRAPLPDPLDGGPNHMILPAKSSPSDGSYTCRAYGIGKHRVTLGAARRDNLALGEVSLYIEVLPRAEGDEELW